MRDVAAAGREALRLDPFSVDAHVLLGRLAEANADWPVALRHAEDALRALAPPGDASLAIEQEDGVLERRVQQQTQELGGLSVSRAAGIHRLRCPR
jgi:hypothetical protein